MSSRLPAKVARSAPFGSASTASNSFTLRGHSRVSCRIPASDCALASVVMSSSCACCPRPPNARANYRVSASSCAIGSVRNRGTKSLRRSRIAGGRGHHQLALQPGHIERRDLRRPRAGTCPGGLSRRQGGGERDAPRGRHAVTTSPRIEPKAPLIGPEVGCLSFGFARTAWVTRRRVAGSRGGVAATLRWQRPTATRRRVAPACPREHAVPAQRGVGLAAIQVRGHGRPVGTRGERTDAA